MIASPQPPTRVANDLEPVTVILPPPENVYNLGPAYHRHGSRSDPLSDSDIISMFPTREEHNRNEPSLSEEYLKSSKFHSEVDAIVRAQEQEEKRKKDKDRISPGFDNEDLMAMLRGFDNVSDNDELTCRCLGVCKH